MELCSQLHILVIQAFVQVTKAHNLDVALSHIVILIIFQLIVQP